MIFKKDKKKRLFAYISCRLRVAIIHIHDAVKERNQHIEYLPLLQNLNNDTETEMKTDYCISQGEYQMEIMH